MAVVDFSNATIERLHSFGAVSSSYGAYLGLVTNDLRALNVYSSSAATVVTNASGTILEDTSTKFKKLFSGVFTADGNAFEIGGIAQADRYWRVSNISFEEGDTYAFTVEIDLSNL